ncbi:nucleotidyltransferase domain-containing protein [Dyadobacter sp. CY327]|jgi:predicted nucleotidyltransferase|uniref:nucleotidyltransferase family protein n=1 Tax=Dyadobacter sp. CY327 TaxID=2907301 RepID=UPI001F48F22E|nr:nucleotidyltransferase domain-containing protein [Dyadobacter sp. CY327]MCE7073554.1 nucleotidyltransferase domain-containing protein [Dyadobacter sp. CY327]
MDKSQLYQNLKNYLLQKKVTKAAVFGSFARNEENDDSDLDLLIEASGLTMFDILRIEDELESIFKRKIDLVEFKAVKSSIQKYVFENTVELI